LKPAVGSDDSGADHPSQITTGHQNDIPCLDGDIGVRSEFQSLKASVLHYDTTGTGSDAHCCTC
jgi:hypothetical protein